MSYKIADFSGQIQLVGMIHKWYATRAAELNAIVAALGTDATRRSTELQTGPTQVLRPGHRLNTRFTNDIMLIVNAGKGGNLLPSAMATAITAVMSKFLIPVNTVAPVVSGTATVGSVLTSTTGTWLYAPTRYFYQWTRNGSAIGTNTPTYTTVAADSGTSVRCTVFAYNPAGDANAPSNILAIA
jgi:hypothetical protein